MKNELSYTMTLKDLNHEIFFVGDILRSIDEDHDAYNPNWAVKAAAKKLNELTTMKANLLDNSSLGRKRKCQNHR